MKLKDHLGKIQASESPADLEALFQAAWRDFPHGRSSDRIHAAMRDRGTRLCAEHPRGTLIPRFDTKTRRLHICGQQMAVMKGHNSSGVRYAWSAAEEFALRALGEAGVSHGLSKTIWNTWSDYPHRALRALDADTTAGGFPEAKPVAHASL